MKNWTLVNKLYQKSTEMATSKVLDHEFNEIKVEIFLEQREVAFLSPSKICRNLNFQRFTVEKFKFSQPLSVLKIFLL